MNSSTSSSKSSPRKMFLWVFLAATVGMASAQGLVNLFTIVMDASAETILDRVTEARQALPQIVQEEQDIVMAFGSSMTDAGFSARQFDRQMAERGVEVKSFNFGFGGLNPYFQKYLARRIQDTFEANDRKLKLAIIEFVPFQVTQSRWNGAKPVVDSFLTMLATPEEMFAIAKEDPTRAVRLLNIHYLRRDISAEMTTWFFSEPLRSGPPRSDLEEDEKLTQRLREVGEELNKRFEEDYPDFDGKDWQYKWQGAGTIPEERSAETLELFEEYYELRRQRLYMENDKLNRIYCCDIEELQFEPILVESFIEIIQTFQEFSEYVEVVLLPRNTDWIHYSPEAEARMQAVLDRLVEETGVTIRNEQLLEKITPEMFSDTTHFARYSGDVAWTEHLVDVYAPILKNMP